MTTRWHKKLVSYSFIAIISIILVSNMFITLWILTAIGKKLAFKKILKSMYCILIIWFYSKKSNYFVFFLQVSILKD